MIVFLSLEITALPSSALATLLMCGKRRDVWLGVRHVTQAKAWYLSEGVEWPLSTDFEHAP